ncbi:hypothetical protein NQ317_014689, partial [Molorchus minor]
AKNLNLPIRKQLLIMRIVPDEVLENLNCKVCCKYLTVSPIGVHPDGGNVCGRCLYGMNTTSTCLFECKDYPNSEMSIPLSLLGYATYPENLFPSLTGSKVSGCEELLPFSSIKSHETTCIYKKYNCPLCHFSGVGSQLIHHFKLDHKRYLSEDHPVFVLNLDRSFSEIYLQFVVETSCLGSTVGKLGKIELVFRVQYRGDALDGTISTCDDEYCDLLSLLSDRVSMSKGSCFNLTFKTDLRFSEAKKVLCTYKIVFIE